MNAQPFIDRRGHPRHRPTAARAVIAGDSTLIAEPWPRWIDADALRRWDALAARATEPNPFFESWYLLPALRAFDPAGTIRIARFERGGELIGLMPLTRARRYGQRPFPHLAGWLHPNCFLGAPLVAPGAEQAFWRALLAWADGMGGTALFLHLAQMPLEGPLADALVAVGRAEDRRIAIVQREQRAMLRSPLSPETYLQQAVPGKKRKEYRRQHARLSEQGALAFHRRDDAGDIGPWIDRFLTLEARGWKGRAGSALLNAPATESLFRQALAEAARRGRLERLSLDLDGQPIAMLANFLTPPGAFSFKTAFDEAHARFSPGVLIQLENLALLQRDGIAWCDSCASADHPMIDSLWTERRAVGRVSIAIGGTARRSAFDALVTLELARNPVPAPIDGSLR